MDLDRKVETANMSDLLHPNNIKDLVAYWLKEDMPSFDYGGFVVGEKEECAILLSKTDGK